MLQSNIIFCDICCFRCVSLWISSLKDIVFARFFYINIFFFSTWFCIWSYYIISILQNGSCRVRNLLLASVLVNALSLGISKSICTPNFDEISQSMAELLHHIGITDFINISRRTAEVWHHIDFSRLRLTVMLNFMWVTLDTHQVQLCVPACLRYKFGVNWIYSFGDIAI